MAKKDAEAWARHIESEIDAGQTPARKDVAGVKTFGALIDLHIEDMKEVGNPLGRTKAYSLELLKNRLIPAVIENDRWYKPFFSSIAAWLLALARAGLALCQRQMSQTHWPLVSAGASLKISIASGSSSLAKTGRTTEPAPLPSAWTSVTSARFSPTAPSEMPLRWDRKLKLGLRSRSPLRLLFLVCRLTLQIRTIG